MYVHSSYLAQATLSARQHQCSAICFYPENLGDVCASVPICGLVSPRRSSPETLG